MKLIAFTMTVEQMRAGTQDVTRRKRWLGLQPGTRLMAVDRTTGMAPGERPTELGELEVVSVRREPLNAITPEDVAREGYPGKDPDWFVTHFVQHQGGSLRQEVTRIEFRRVGAVAHGERGADDEEPTHEPVERACRECGCTDEAACDPPCHWVGENLCSACVLEEPDVEDLEFDDDEELERELNRAARVVADESVDAAYRDGCDLTASEGRYLTLRCLHSARTLEERIAAFLEPHLDDDQIRTAVEGIAGVIRASAPMAD